ncbi:hypothetical protein L3X38_035393 [Prunus dulcis]|uniref:Uncharacterized protein n=1 Tax=Prunus dulcis TaxID=3755 RepID=A0AAD4YYS5_PRUDU|nr:hypothetical protein L3X38_035393 [Prunus dulcis]
MDFQKKRIQLVAIIAGIIVLSITAEKCRQLVGEKYASRSGQFTFLNCFDMSSGTLACSVKEGVKLYVNNIRASHVERTRYIALESALADALSQGIPAKDAAKQAQKAGEKAAKLATRQAKRIIGPIISSGWDFFEAIYYGGAGGRIGLMVYDVINGVNYLLQFGLPENSEVRETSAYESSEAEAFEASNTYESSETYEHSELR